MTIYRQKFTVLSSDKPVRAMSLLYPKQSVFALTLILIQSHTTSNIYNANIYASAPPYLSPAAEDGLGKHHKHINLFKKLQFNYIS